MTLHGGLRDRAVWASLYWMVYDGLEQLGWLDDPVANDIPRQPVYVPWGGFPDGEPITVNAVSVMPEDNTYSPLETGSNAEFKNRFYVIDVYAEDHAVGIALRGDISAMLRGQHPTIGRDQNKLDVYDYDMATPAIFATMDIENVRDDRAIGGSEPWERYWYSILLTIEDEDWGSS